MRTLKLTLTDEHWDYLHKLRTQIGARSLAGTVRYFIQREFYDITRGQSAPAVVKVEALPTVSASTAPKPRHIVNGIDITDCKTAADIQAAHKVHKEKLAVCKLLPNHPTYDDYIIECELEEDTGKLSYTDWQYCKENGVIAPTYGIDAWNKASLHPAYDLLSKRDGKPWVPYPLQIEPVE